MKYIVKLLYFIGFAGWAVYLIKFMTVDNMDMELFYCVKTIFFMTMVCGVSVLERWKSR